MQEAEEKQDKLEGKALDDKENNAKDVIAMTIKKMKSKKSAGSKSLVQKSTDNLEEPSSVDDAPLPKNVTVSKKTQNLVNKVEEVVDQSTTETSN